MNTILIIEDELAIRRFLKAGLDSKKYHLLEADTGQTALALAQEQQPNLFLLDLNLPDMDGLEIIKGIRAWTSTPIIVISARDEEEGIAQALDLGADDYVTKPFSMVELNSRINVALRHAQRIIEIEQPICECNELKIDLINRKVWCREKEITLSPIQYKILAILARRMNKIVTHKQLLDEVWQDKEADIEYLRIYIHQLRQKIEENPAFPQYLQTEPGVGYRLVCEGNS